MRRKNLVRLAILATTIATGYYSTHLELANIKEGKPGTLFRVEAIRTISRYTPADLTQVVPFFSDQEIQVSVAGISVNCLISPRLQPDDSCAIYRHMINSHWLSDEAFPIWVWNPYGLIGGGWTKMKQ